MLETCFMKRCGSSPVGGSIPRALLARKLSQKGGSLGPMHCSSSAEEVAGCCGVRRKPSVQYDKQRHVKNIKVFASSVETIFAIMYQNDQYHILHPSQLLIVLIFLDADLVLCISTERE